MTSLVRQLERLAVPHTQTVLADDRKRVSLLFDSREAANLDRDAVFAIGINGLEELINRDAAFADFESTLYNEYAQGFERSLQTKEVNTRLDEILREFLTRLSPYFLLRPAHKALEWLIYRYHIHQYNVDDILLCILPYHDTKIFVRVVQLLKLSSPTSKWNWLEPLQKPGIPLPISTLVNHCYKDPAFFNFICTMVPQFIKVFGVDSTGSPLNVVLSFYAMSLIGAVGSMPAITDSFVAQLLPFLVRGFKSRCLDYRAATYMILCQLLQKAKLQQSFIDAILPILSRHIPAKFAFEAIACVSFIFQTQKVQSLSKKTFKNICRVPGAVQSLVRLHQGGALASALPHLLRRLVPAAMLDDGAGATSSDGGGSSEDRLPSPQYASLLTAFLTDVRLQHDDAVLVTRLLLDSFTSFSGSSRFDTDVSNDVATRIRDVFRLMEKRYPRAVDAVVQQCLVSKDVDDGLVRLFIGLSVSSSSRHASVAGAQQDLSLSLALNHAEETYRLLGIRQLIDLVRSGGLAPSDEFMRSSLLARLTEDDSVLVVEAALALEPEKLRDILTHNELLLVVQRLLRHRDSVAWRASQVTALGALLGGSWQGAPLALTHSVMAVVLSLAVAADEESPELAKVVLTSDFANQGLLQGAAKDFAKARNARSRTSKQPSVNNMLVEKLAESLCQATDDERKHFVTVVMKPSADNKKLAVLLLRIFSTMLHLWHEKADLHSSPAAYDCVGWCLDLTTFLLPKVASEVSDNDYNATVESLWKVVRFCKLPSATDHITWWLTELSSPGASRNGSSSPGLAPLIAVFELLLECSLGTAKNPRCLSNRRLLATFLKETLPEAELWTRFLTTVWLQDVAGEDCGTSATTNEPSVVLAQVRALLVAREMFAKADEADRIAAALNASQCVVPGLLLALGHSQSCVRSAALDCASQIVASCNSFPGRPLLEYLCNSAAELLADPAHVQQVMATYFEQLLVKESSKSSRRSVAATADFIFGIIDSELTPRRIVHAILATLQFCPSQLVFRRLLPLLKRLIVSCHSADVFLNLDLTTLLIISRLLECCDSSVAATFDSSTDAGWVLFISAFDVRQSAGEMKSPQLTAIGQVNKEFFNSLRLDELKQQLLCKLFDVWVDSDAAAVHSAVSRSLRGLSIEAQLLVHELQLLVKVDADTTVKAKRMKRMSEAASSAIAPEQMLDGHLWRRATLILELLHTKKKLHSAHLLVPVLFGLLARCLDIAKSSNDESEYVKQLLLSCIHHVCQKVSSKEGNADLLTEQLFNVELIVLCIRSSSSPQTHQHALLLLSLAAGMFPDHVLHNVMAIFTFMGASIMRQDDAYSFEVIGRTLDAVIPPLVDASTCKDGSGPEAQGSEAVRDVVRVFVDAYPHVPEHRRLPLFSRLVDTLGVNSHLWLVVALLAERHALLTPAVTSSLSAQPLADFDQSKSAILDFMLSLTLNYSASVILHNSRKLLAYLAELPDDKDDKAKVVFKMSSKAKSGAKKPVKESNCDFELISIETLTATQLRFFKYASAGYIVSILTATDFIGKVGEENRTGSITGQLQALLEQSLQYVTVVGKAVDAYSSSATARFWKALLHRAYDILDKVNALLPGDVFVSVVTSLLQHKSLAIQRKAMQLLNGRLQKTQQWRMTPREVDLLLAVADQLLGTISMSPDKINSENETAINTQTALYTLKLLAAALAFDHPDRFKPMLPFLTALVPLVESSKTVLASVFLCLAELILCLRVHAIAYLPRFLPHLLRVLADEASLLSNDLLWLSVVTAAQKAVEAMPNFLSPYILTLLTATVRLTCLASGENGSAWTNCTDISSSSSTRAQLCHRLRVLREKLATSVAPRVLVPAIAECYSLLMADNGSGDAGASLNGSVVSSRASALMDVLSAHISSLSKEDLQHFHGQLLNFFLVALDFRTVNSQLDLHIVAVVEEHMISAFIAMVMRLSEAAFRPMYFKVFDWACRQGQSKDRLLIFYRLSDTIAGKLKGLFCLFAGHLIKNAAELLTDCHSSKPDTIFGKATDVSIKKTCLLLDAILDCLGKCFLYNNEGFATKERFDTLMQPLVDQIENTLGNKDTYENRMVVHLIPCISQLAVAIGDDALWKPLNYQVCLKTRHVAPRVRMTALLAIRSLNSKLTQDYLPLLPETIPFLAELMEDESTEVEKLCQEVISDMEEVLGEPLQKYF